MGQQEEQRLLPHAAPLLLLLTARAWLMHLLVLLLVPLPLRHRHVCPAAVHAALQHCGVCACLLE